ncbi:MAG: HAD-IIIA family hydrolase [Bacteroidota bacterium]
MNKAVFLDRDGVLNREIGDYVFTPDTFEVLPGVPEALRKLKDSGYYLIVVTNQGGIDKGLFTDDHFREMMDILDAATGGIIDKVYYARRHRSFTKSLMSKPDSLMIEKGIARFNIDPAQSWMIGDAERDLIAGKKCGISTILIPTLKETHSPFADIVTDSLARAADFILKLDAQNRPA